MSWSHHDVMFSGFQTFHWTSFRSEDRRISSSRLILRQVTFFSLHSVVQMLGVNPSMRSWIPPSCFMLQNLKPQQPLCRPPVAQRLRWCIMSPPCISQNWLLPASFQGLKALIELTIELFRGLGTSPWYQLNGCHHILSRAKDNRKRGWASRIVWEVLLLANQRSIFKTISFNAINAFVVNVLYFLFYFWCIGNFPSLWWRQKWRYEPLRAPWCSHVFR